MSACEACETAERDPLSGLYWRGCRECSARALAHSPAYAASQVSGRMRPNYAYALRTLAGDDAAAREALHRRVRHWAQRIDEARAAA